MAAPTSNLADLRKFVLLLEAMSRASELLTVPMLCSVTQLSRSSVDNGLHALVARDLVLKGKRMFARPIRYTLTEHGVRVARQANVLLSLLECDQPRREGNLPEIKGLAVPGSGAPHPAPDIAAPELRFPTMMTARH